ncbi:UDP-N-acetylmuramate--L-alanine ligase [Nonlabens ponticola]|uniref:Peptidoglycan synthetase n=1 Tax=Nonlabens ponticola TaxID=2496866 RepID=A0A3S9MUM4_9FLAO|nr:Mur ligase family protein [Nonlabens ponticola]AZQ42871.1 peptidoglycan synthetase [Nonlabens ponticola]
MRVHFIAIGGSAMHNLAIALHLKGDQVTGSDDAIFEPSKSRLKKHGLLPDTIGWDNSRIDDSIDAVILGMHAKEDNPELLKAQELDLKIYSYPEYLYEQSKNKTRVVIGGSHGKTTITSMILHVMHYHDREVDYMVGAQLEGFETMVHLTDDNEFMVLEGDEYLSSPIDRRPKFHLYQPNIALISGIAWDHINVFPTYENYVEQFEIFVDLMKPGSILVYNEEDKAVKQIAEEARKPTRKHAYSVPDHSIDNGKTFLETPEGDMPLEIFGKHNLSNLAGAKWICQHMGIDEDAFYEAIATFKGASKRLEMVAESSYSVIYKDFAHSPSKVKATTNAIHNQYSERKIIACLELHTFSSLDPVFLQEYANALDCADVAVVFYSPEAVELKRLEPVTAEQIKEAFDDENLIVMTDPAAFKSWLFSQNLNQAALLLMSSGTYGGLDFDRLGSLVDPLSKR